MLDHVTLNVRDLAASRAFFYEQALEPLGHAFGFEHGDTVGSARPIDIRASGSALESPSAAPPTCASAPPAEPPWTRSTRRRWPRAAGTTGLRGSASTTRGTTPLYVLDPDGNNIEALTYEEAWAAGSTGASSR